MQCRGRFFSLRKNSPVSKSQCAKACFERCKLYRESGRDLNTAEEIYQIGAGRDQKGTQDAAVASNE